MKELKSADYYIKTNDAGFLCGFNKFINGVGMSKFIDEISGYNKAEEMAREIGFIKTLLECRISKHINMLV